MKLFGKGIAPDEPSQDGKVLVRISIDRVDRQTRKVKIIVVERSSGRTIYKLRYTTQKSDRPAYFEAENYVKQFVIDNDYVIDGRISSNVQLPVIQNVSTRMR